jgi:uncharacterized protein with GYD domain
MSDEEAILDEAMDNLRQAAQRIRATRNRLWSAGMKITLTTGTSPTV